MKKYKDVKKNVIALFVEVGFEEKDGYLELLSKDTFTQIYLQKSQYSNAFFINVSHGSLRDGGIQKKLIEERMSDHGIPGTSFQLWDIDNNDVENQVACAIQSVLLPWLTVFQIKDNFIALNRWEYLESDIPITRSLQPFNLANFPKHYHVFISQMEARGFIFKVENIGFSFFKQQGDIWDVISVNLESCGTSLSVMVSCWIPEFEKYAYDLEVNTPKEVKSLSSICCYYIESEKLAKTPLSPIFIGNTSAAYTDLIIQRLLYLVDNISTLMFSNITDSASLIENINVNRISTSRYEALVTDLHTKKLQH